MLLRLVVIVYFIEVFIKRELIVMLVIKKKKNRDDRFIFSVSINFGWICIYLVLDLRCKFFLLRVI